MQHVFRSRFFAVLIGATFIALDQWIKVLALLSLQADSFRFGSDYAWVDVALSLNPGAFLSLGGDLSPGFKKLIFIGFVAVAVLLAAGWSLVRWARSLGTAAAVYLIALGGASNLIDRIYRDGHVVDYLTLNLGPLHTGVFNVADIAIMVGAGLLVLFEIRKPAKPHA
jgi:signal peptidase II